MSQLLSLFEQYSYLILAIGIFLELMALPISGQLLMAYAGYFAFLGKMSYPLAFLTAFGAAVAGITITYVIGKTGGYKLVEKYGRYIHLTPEKYKKTSSWFERSGKVLLVFSYFIPGVRHFAGYVSGISRLPFRSFAIPAYSGALLWSFGFVTLGKILGPQWSVFHDAAGHYFMYFVAAGALLVAAFLGYRHYKDEIKAFSKKLLKWILAHSKTIRAAEFFLSTMALVSAVFAVLMIGLAQNYWHDEFSQFNAVTKYVLSRAVFKNSLASFSVFGSGYTLFFLLAITVSVIWAKNRNRLLEYSLLVVCIVGAKLFHILILIVLSPLKIGAVRSEDFPEFGSFMLMVVYGSSLFLLARHSVRNFALILASLAGLFALLCTGIAKVLSIDVLPSDIVGGYVYGAVWISFNFLLFEMIRLIINEYRKG
ncbi:DedA family protein [Neobacillus piezotolerans]|uniref:DedA family protein n=1 Tax=Neobacillus piezotolerans TaxID=2259171 RepID=A0A3D8GMZ6_9BACI|nr:VTT domain-containing protein [Neobacillus piezotolerans]RDU35687.1 DedA family protein [Neobacillus piezotolerans]